MDRFKIIVFSLAFLALPLVTFAQTIADFLDEIYELALGVIPLMIGLGVFFFVFASSQFIWESGNTDDRQRRRFLFFWGIIALTIAVSVDTIIRIVIRTFF